MRRPPNCSRARDPRAYGQPPSYSSVDAVRRSKWVFVFPNTNDQPSVGFKLDTGTRIAFLVRKELRAPERLVGSRPRPMARAAMPEAAINKDGYPRTTEDDVRSAR